MGLFHLFSDAASLLLSAAESQSERIATKQKKFIHDYEKKLDTYEQAHPDSQRVAEARKKLETACSKVATARIRRTDEEIAQDPTGTELNPRDFQCERNVPLPDAIHSANKETGVYILFLNGQVMKCGRAAYKQGIHWRFTQYYNLNYDKRARAGDYWSVSPGNRDAVTVSWQCCPPSKCSELEYKLFQKYGKGPWAQRAPQRCLKDSWELLL